MRLILGNNGRLGEIRFETWLTQQAVQIPSTHHQPAGVAVATQEKESHKKLTEIATAHITGERGNGKIYRPSPPPHTTRLPTRRPFVRVPWPAEHIEHCLCARSTRDFSSAPGPARAVRDDLLRDVQGIGAEWHKEVDCGHPRMTMTFYDKAGSEMLVEHIK